MIQKNTRRRRKRVKVFIEKPTKRNWRAKQLNTETREQHGQSAANKQQQRTENCTYTLSSVYSILCALCVYQRRTLLRMSTSHFSVAARLVSSSTLFTAAHRHKHTRRPCERVWRFGFTVGRSVGLADLSSFCAHLLWPSLSRERNEPTAYTHTHDTIKLDLHWDCTWNTKQFLYILFRIYKFCERTQVTRC